MFRFSAIVAPACAVALSMAVVETASAACTRLAFSVNDYGKDGPTRDAKNLLDKYIAKWAADRKITGHTTGPKEVTCELFLDFGFFDEYTCKAAATVCWNGPLPKNHETEAGTPPPAVNKAAQTPARVRPAAAAPADPATGGAPRAPQGAPVATGSVNVTPKASVAAPVKAPPAPAAPREAN